MDGNNDNTKDRDRLYELVEELSTSGRSELDEKSLKSVKKLCKKSPANQSHLYHMLMSQIEKEHSEIRVSCFQIIDEIFSRSHLFRQLVLDNFQQLMELCLETNDEKKLPPPKNAAKRLKLMSLSSIDKWQQKFGKHYKKLDLGYDYLKRVKKINFAGVRSTTLLEQQRQELSEVRQKELEQRSIQRVEKEIKEMCNEIETAILQGNNCLDLILPPPCDLYPNNPSVDGSADICSPGEIGKDCTADSSSVAASPIRTSNVGNCHGIPAPNYNLTITIPLERTVITETADNTDLLRSLKDVMNEIENKFLPVVNKWTRILSKSSSNVHKKLEECVHLKGKLNVLREKYEEIEVVPLSQDGCNDDNDCDDDAEGFIDVPEADVLDTDLQDEDSIDAEESHNMEACRPTSSTNTEPGPLPNNGKESKKKQLLSNAPVVSFDNDLKYWGTSKLHITPITKNDSLHKFWSNGEHDDEFIPNGLEESLRSRAMVFAGTFERVKWKCRAPLANGKLCERQDRVKCPFHGTIIARDETGQPTNPDDQAIEAERKRKKDEVEAEEIRNEVEMATGNDLGSKGKKAKRIIANKTRQRYSRLTDLKKVINTSRNRLEKKVLDKGALRRVEEATIAVEKRRNLEKFGSNFNYHYDY